MSNASQQGPPLPPSFPFPSVAGSFGPPSGHSFDGRLDWGSFGDMFRGKEESLRQVELPCLGELSVGQGGSVAATQAGDWLTEIGPVMGDMSGPQFGGNKLFQALLKRIILEFTTSGTNLC